MMGGRLRIWALIALLGLAGCTGSVAPPAATLTSTPRPDPTALPTPDGWTLASAPLTLETVPQLRELGRLTAPEPPSTVFAYALSLDNALLAGLNNEFVLVWDLFTGDQLFVAERRGANAILFGPDRQQIFTLSDSGELRVYDALRGSVVETLGAFDQYNGVWAYDPLGGWLALGSDDGAVQVWDMLERIPLTVLESIDVPVTALAFSPDGAALATSDRNGTLRFWDFQNGQQGVSADLLTTVSKIVYAPSGSVLAINSGDGVLVMDPATGNVVASLAEEPTDGLFEFLGQADLLVLGGESTDLSLWDPFTGALAAILPGTKGDRVSAAGSPQGEMLLASSRASTSLWNISRISAGTVLRGSIGLPSADVLRVVWTADGLQILIFEALGPVRVFGIP